MPNWKNLISKTTQVCRNSLNQCKEKVTTYANSEEYSQLKENIKKKLIPDEKNIQVYQDNLNKKYEDFEKRNQQGIKDIYEQMKDKSLQMKEQLVNNKYDGKEQKQSAYEEQGTKFDFNKLFNGTYFNQKINNTGRTFGFYFLMTIFLYSFGSNIPYALVHYIQYRNQKKQFDQQLEMQGLLQQK